MIRFSSHSVLLLFMLLGFWLLLLCFCANIFVCISFPWSRNSTHLVYQFCILSIQLLWRTQTEYFISRAFSLLLLLCLFRSHGFLNDFRMRLVLFLLLITYSLSTPRFSAFVPITFHCRQFSSLNDFLCVCVCLSVYKHKRGNIQNEWHLKVSGNAETPSNFECSAL